MMMRENRMPRPPSATTRFFTRVRQIPQKLQQQQQLITMKEQQQQQQMMVKEQQQRQKQLLQEWQQDDWQQKEEEQEEEEQEEEEEEEEEEENNGVKRREAAFFDEEAWARHPTTDLSSVYYKLRHMQESEGTTQVSGDDYGEVAVESEDDAAAAAAAAAASEAAAAAAGAEEEAPEDEEELRGLVLQEEEDDEEGVEDEGAAGDAAAAGAEEEGEEDGEEEDEAGGEAAAAVVAEEQEQQHEEQEEEEEEDEDEDDEDVEGLGRSGVATVSHGRAAGAAARAGGREEEDGAFTAEYAAVYEAEKKRRQQRRLLLLQRDADEDEEGEEVLDENDDGGVVVATEEDNGGEEEEEEEGDGENEDADYLGMQAREKSAEYFYGPDGVDPRYSFAESEEGGGVGFSGVDAEFGGKETSAAADEDELQLEDAAEQEDGAGFEYEEEFEEEDRERELEEGEAAYSKNETGVEQEEGAEDAWERLDEAELSENAAAEVDAEITEDDSAAGSELIGFPLEDIDARVEVHNVEGKGRCLYTQSDVEPGEIIFVESPVFVAIPSVHPSLWKALEALHEKEPFELPPVWHLGALSCLLLLPEEQKDICLDKWCPDPDAPPGADVLRVLQQLRKLGLLLEGQDVDAQLYQRLLMIWRYNSFGHHQTDQPGLVLYNRTSMMAHSCRASACWHYGVGDALVLRARVKMHAGDELTISYIGDEDLFKSTEVRREKVTGWLFTCRCLRCIAPVDTARGFKCPVCCAGNMFFKTEYGKITSSPCTTCEAVPSAETIREYVTFEEAYVDRLSETDKSDMPDAEQIYEQATRIFSQHWVLYQLQTILFEGYRDAGEYEMATIYQMERIKYVSQVMPLASYTLAWLYEEMGDTLMNRAKTVDKSIPNGKLNIISQHFENAYNLLFVLCGEDHDYTVAAATKKQNCDSLLTAAT